MTTPPFTHNQPKTLDAIAHVNIETGVWLLCKEALVTAIQDRRLERSHLRVLAVIADHMNKFTAKASPTRQVIAAAIGVEVATVSNMLSELRLLGYLVSERQLDETTNRKLTFYSFGRIDHDTIRREVTRYISQIRDAADTKSSPPAVNSVPTKGVPKAPIASPPTVKFTAHGEVHSSPPTVNITAHGEQFTDQKHRSRTHTPLLKKLDSESNNKPSTPPLVDTSPPAVNSEKSKRGARLPDDWRLPKSWGEWTLATFHATPSQVRQEAERFKNHWLSTAGKGAIKLDWYRTWQNWCASSYRAWPRKQGAPGENVAPELTESDAAAEAKAYDALWGGARAQLSEDDA